MKIAIVILQNLVRALGLALIALGFLFWGGRATELIPIHMRLGETLIAMLWIIAAIGARANVSKGLVLGAVLYGFLIFLYAMNMGGLLPGAAHEAIRVVHFLFGLGAIGLAEAIGGTAKRNLAAAR